MDKRETCLTAVILAVLFAGILFVSGLQYRTPDETTGYTVQPGDTVWAIAEKHCPNSHTGNVCLKIKDINHIDGYIYPGDVLIVPVEKGVAD